MTPMSSTRPRWFAIGLALWLGAVVAVPLGAQGSLSAQVLRLLDRENVWSALQTYQNGTVALEAAGSAPTTTTDRLYNVGGSLYWNGSLLGVAPSGVGTVTSVDLALPAIFTVTGNPVTASGTLTATLAVEPANMVWAGPTSGVDAAPTFRALVASDIPSLSGTYVTPDSATLFTNKTGAISQWTNDAGYVTSSVATLSALTAVGTITTGDWQGTVIAGAYGGTGVANTGKTLTLGGNFSTADAFTVTGANAVTLATTGATSLTLPTAGTLATTATTSLASLATVGTITSGTWQGTAVGVGYGGTGLATYTIGDLLYASGATTLSKLAGVATGNVLLSGGVATAPSWGKVNLTSAVTGTLPAANGGTAVTSTPSNGQLLIGNGTGYTLATLTGTSNQVTVTNGAGTITLALPQAIATASTPQFGRLGLGTGAGSVAALTIVGSTTGGLISNGNSGTSKTIDWSAGDYQTLTLTGNATLTASNVTTGQTLVLRLVQDGTGSRTVTWWTTIKWQGGSAPTLTATASKTDIVTCRATSTTTFDCVASLNY